MDDFDTQNIRVVAILMGMEQAKKMEKTVKPDYEILVDRKGELVDLLGIRHRGAIPISGKDLPQPSSCLISREGELIWHTLAKNCRVRPRPDEILIAAMARMYKKSNER